MAVNSDVWNTSDNYGADLTGTLSGDTASGPEYMGAPAVAPVPAQPQGFAGVDYASTLGLPPAGRENFEKLRAMGIQNGIQQNQPQQAITNYSINAKTGMAKLEMPQSALADVMAQLTDLQTMKSAAMARVAQLRQQEASGSPLIDALSQFAGNMAANDPTMPGWVRALGATNLAMGPQGIKRERMMEEQKAFQYGQAGANLALQAEKLSEYSETQKAKLAADSLEARKVAVAEKAQAANERNQIQDNFRSDLRPVFDEIKATGLFNADQESAIRATALNHPDLPKGAVEAEIAKAKGNAAAARAEIERKAAETRRNISLRASEYAGRLAAQEGKQIRGQVVRANLAQAGKLADEARLNEKEATRLNGLNEMAIAADRMTNDLAADPTWQGVIGGRIADTQLTTEMQKKLSDSADLFVKKMGSIGLSFAKTSDAEMKKILATVPTATMTVKQANRLLEILDQEGKRTAEFLAARNWAESPEGIAAAIPGKYRDVALRAHADRQAKLTPQQRLAYGLATGDEVMVQSEVERSINGSPGGNKIVGPPNSARPGEIRMAAPTVAKDDPFGLKGFLPKR